MPEFGGADLGYVDPYDVPALAAALGRLLDDPALRARLAEAARARSQAYCWDRSGARTWQAIRAAARCEHPVEPLLADPERLAAGMCTQPLPAAIRR
jgi:glycosyltransferase involved in cell wall biosynthesis